MSPSLKSFTFLAAIPGLLTTQPETHIAIFALISSSTSHSLITFIVIRFVYPFVTSFPFATSEKGLVANDIFHNLLNLVGKRDKSSLPFWIKLLFITFAKPFKSGTCHVGQGCFKFCLFCFNVFDHRHLTIILWITRRCQSSVDFVLL